MVLSFYTSSHGWSAVIRYQEIPCRTVSQGTASNPLLSPVLFGKFHQKLVSGKDALICSSHLRQSFKHYDFENIPCIANDKAGKVIASSI